MDKMDRKELEEILERNSKQTNANIEKLARNTDYKLEIITNDISGIKEDLNFVKEDLNQVKVDLSEVKTDLSEVKTDLSEVKTDLFSLTEKVDVIFEQTGKLTVGMEIVQQSVQRHEQKIKQL